MTFGLTPYGFVAKRLVDIKTDMEDSMIAEFGDINIEPQSVFGQLIGVLSKTTADVWDNMEAIYNSQYPATAEGTSLDNVVALNGITRLPSERTSVIGLANGLEGTQIDEGSLARIPSSEQVFYSFEDVILSSSTAGTAQISLTEVATQVYTIVVNSNQFTYSLPTITFDASFQPGDEILVTLNGTNLTAVPYNTSNAQTLTDLATSLQSTTSILSAISDGTDTIDVYPDDGFSTNISVVVTGGTPPNATITYRVPPAIISFDIDFEASNEIVATLNGSELTSVPFNSDQATTAGDLVTVLQAQPEIDSVVLSGSNRIFTITPNTDQVVVFNSAIVTGGTNQAVSTIENPVLARISEIINAGSEPVLALDEGFGTMTLEADDYSVSFSLTLGANLSLEDFTTPVEFLAQEFGPIPAPANTMTEILTSIAGWVSVTNPVDGSLGRDVETDSELRIRRRNSILLVGAGTVESIRARILQQVAGVTSAFVYENKTMQQENCTVTFSADLITANTIDLTLNTTPIAQVTFATDHDTTMQLIVNALETLTSLVASASFGGASNRVITIVPVLGIEIEILTGLVQLGVSQATVSTSAGRYPKSFEVIASGGENQDIGDKIWETKPAGIQTFGNTSVNVTDSQGDTQVIFFSRPTSIYIWVRCELTLYDEETFPNNGLQAVQEVIFNYGSSLDIGVDVLLQRVQCQIFEIEGIAKGTVTIAATPFTTTTPVYGTSDLDVGETEISNWALDRITISLAP